VTLPRAVSAVDLIQLDVLYIGGGIFEWNALSVPGQVKKGLGAIFILYKKAR